MWAATQEGLRSQQPPAGREVNPSEIIDEEDIEESTGDQMSALKRMRRSQLGALSSKDAKEIMSQLE